MHLPGGDRETRHYHKRRHLPRQRLRENQRAGDRLYCHTCAAGKIEMLDGAGPWDPTKIVYIFISNPADISKTGEPTAAIPLVQSYVDICINGCQEIEAQYSSAGGFVQESIRTATGWNAYWVNDRIYPRRPFIYVPNASQIDQVL